MMRWFTLAMIRLYQRTWTAYTPNCWQTPSCSQYGYEAVRNHGFKIGIIMTADRIKTCTAENKEKHEAAQEHLHDHNGSRIRY